MQTQQAVPLTGSEGQILSYTGHAFDIRPIVQEPVTTHEQTKADKEHAAAQFERFSRETSPARLAPEEKKVEAEKVTKPEATKEVEAAQLEKINLIQKNLLTEVIRDPNLQAGIEKMLTDKQNIPAVLQAIEAFEKGLETKNPHGFALFTLLTKMAVIQIKQVFSGTPMLFFPNIDEALTVAVKRVLANRIGPCEEAIRAISPQYLENVCTHMLNKAPGEQLISRVGELMAKMNELSLDELQMFNLLLSAEDKRTEMMPILFPESTPALAEEMLDFIDKIDDPDNRQAVIDGLSKGLHTKIAELQIKTGQV